MSETRSSKSTIKECHNTITIKCSAVPNTRRKFSESATTRYTDPTTMGQSKPVYPVPTINSKPTNKSYQKKEDKKLKIGTWNIRRGVLKRECEIVNVLKEENLDILFLTETDIIIEEEEDLKIEGYKSFFQLRKSNNEKIRIIALVENEMANNTVLRKEVMSTEFPSIWLQTKSTNEKPICIAGFYRQWSFKGDKSEKMQIDTVILCIQLIQSCTIFLIHKSC